MIPRHAIKSCGAFLLRVSGHRQAPPLFRQSFPAIGSRLPVAGTWSHHSRLFSSFQPSPPPGTHGVPVFPNIDFEASKSLQSESNKRNNDPDAVFVVTGANRGIGLQFVKSLTERSKVRLCYIYVYTGAMERLLVDADSTFSSFTRARLLPCAGHRRQRLS